MTGVSHFFVCVSLEDLQSSLGLRNSLALWPRFTLEETGSLLCVSKDLFPLSFPAVSVFARTGGKYLLAL